MPQICRQPLRGVLDCQHLDVILTEAVHDPVLAFEQLTHVVAGVIGDATAGVWELYELPGPAHYLLHRTHRCAGVIFGDMGVDLIQARQCTRRPVQRHSDSP